MTRALRYLGLPLVIAFATGCSPVDMSAGSAGTIIRVDEALVRLAAVRIDDERGVVKGARLRAALVRRSGAAKVMGAAEDRRPGLPPARPPASRSPRTPHHQWSW